MNLKAKVNTDMLLMEMHKKNLTTSGLANISNVDKSTISRLLNGQGCSIITAQLITEALKLSPTKAGQIFFGKKVA